VVRGTDDPSSGRVLRQNLTSAPICPYLAAETAGLTPKLRHGKLRHFAGRGGKSVYDNAEYWASGFSLVTRWQRRRPLGDGGSRMLAR